MARLERWLLCDLLNHHSGRIESYGHYSYVDCRRCLALRQPMPRAYAEVRFGES